GLHFEINRYTKKQGLTGAKIDCLALDNLDRLWIGSREGLLLMIPDRAGAYNQYRKITDADGLPNNYIISLFTDSYHNIWIGCNDAGLTRYQSNGFQSLTTREGLPSNRVSSILEDRKGRIWIATFNNGIARYQRAMGKQPAFFQYFSERNGLSSNKIYKLFEDPHGDIWIGARSGSLMRYAGTMGGQEVFYHYNEGLPGDFVTDIMLDHDDHLWFATQSLELESGSGVCRFGEDQMMFIGVDQGLISEDIWCFSQDSKGTFWFGSWGDGITAYHLPDAHDGRSSIKYFTAYNALGGNKIRSLLSDRYGHTWAGGVGAHGLTRFSANDSSYQVFTTDDGLCDNSVMSMLEDHEGSMWFGGYEGLSLFKDNQFSTFKMEDGFQGVGCLTNAICQTRDERIWVGTYDRLTVFDPHDIITPNRTPYTQITDIKLFNEHIDWKKPQQRLSDGSIVSNFRCDGITPWYQIPTNLSLKHSDNFIQFDYVGISYQGYSKVRYQHRLKGLEQDWNQPSDRSNVSYANLSPGKYIFEVRSKSGNSDWSLPTKYSFRIRPPWWLTWWAYVSYVILFTSMIYVFIRLRVQSAIKKYRAIESLRLKISSDLHDDVGTTLAGLAMQSELIAKQGRNGLTEDLRELSQLSRSAMDQMRDIVWAMDSRRDHYQNLVDRIREFALKQVNKSDFEFHMDTTNIPMDDFLPPDIRQHVYFIIKEAITNSLKHSDGHCIDLTIRQERNNL
ncbi:MAG: hypothetical protein KDC53_23850, partial [Saprospiraceae bacterium]|nr:hypothetical protein [Saprospiraceae bacterium]